MVLPTVRRNTFVKLEEKIYVDNVSKVFVYCELLLGVNRLPVITSKRILIALFYVYSLFVNVLLCYAAMDFKFGNNRTVVIRATRAIQYEISVVLSLFTWKTFRCFYKEIEKFDNEAGCRPKFSRTSLKLLVLFGIVALISLYLLPFDRAYIIPLHIVSTCEHFYFSYLVDLIITRMRLLNYYLECATSNATTNSSPKITEFSFFENDSRRFYFPNMGEMMELYQIIINAHKFLVDAVKWQVRYI